MTIFLQENASFKREKNNHRQYSHTFSYPAFFPSGNTGGNERGLIKGLYVFQAIT